MSDLTQELKFVPGGDVVIAYGADTTGTLRTGRLYRLTATSVALCRFGASAATLASGGADFAVEPSLSVFVRCPNASGTLHVIQHSVAGSLYCALVDEGT